MEKPWDFGQRIATFVAWLPTTNGMLQLADMIAQRDAAIREAARREALEEAARVCERHNAATAVLAPTLRALATGKGER